ncbi:MAG: exodeoxyribonuclease VII large subunit [Desulfocapsaceae bacterium]|jgi:exodeoxyribonuclease VII large subunit|nr:exodeoxyribonuclease VII large subunit [Desulfocapsaceae bacterium]
MSAEIYQLQVKTVSQLSKEIKYLFEQRYQFVRISGEISNLRKPHSGHLYFNLKDNSAQIRAVLFKNRSRFLAEPLADGLQVICDGKITIYEPRGDYQVVVDSIDFCGSGNLQIAFEQLKARLFKEGLFDPAAKQKLPQPIKKIILITSPTGAAVHDFLSVCRKRQGDVAIQILPVRVQGEGSADEIVSALQRAEDYAPDVIVLCRGGGSIEDLWTFNEERVARAIFNCSIPLISAIGHEIDVTIADYCADVRCATPTAAAELLTPHPQELGNAVKRFMQRIARSMLWRLDGVEYRVDRAARVLSAFDTAFYTKTMQLDSFRTRLVEAMLQRLDENDRQLSSFMTSLQQGSPLRSITLQKVTLEFCLKQLQKGIKYQLERKLSRLQEAAAVLDSVSPLATLSRGYSIVSKAQSGEIVSDENQVDNDDAVNIRLYRGMLTCRVIKRT